ncbi:superoxide dismutase family protein [Streptomyces acidicola]|uniref:superoxide dismutase family protein n=1 Tax=Streptomyces acidicola TaxID=2596892 RepID=UPI003430DA55
MPLSDQPQTGRSTTAMAVSLAAVLLGSFALTACGGDTSDSGAGDPKASSEKNSEKDSGKDDEMAMDGMEGMDMGDPDAMPANEIKGADLKEGTFVVLDTAPPDSDAVKGTAWLAQHDDGTTVTVMLSGLEPGTDYMSHLHAQQCAKDNGGDHFQFKKGGPTTPPNEVHLAFTAGDDGKAMMTVNNDAKVGDGARAIVVHPAKAMDNKLACADF